MYNRLVRKRNEVDNAFGGIDVQLKQRCDLIPSLVATVKQYMKHERETLERIVELRNQSVLPRTSPEQKVSLNNEMGQLLGKIRIAVEAYPELKASENFSNLQHSLNEVEAQLAASRRSFNAAVTDYNNAIDVFPTNLIAGIFGFTRRQVFEAQAWERSNVSVNQLFSA
jgi:LemA protein